jgi:hypothetical protein
MTTRHHVDFIATKEVKKPTEVAFKTKTGRSVDFIAKRPVEEAVRVSFIAKNKKK